MSNQEKSPEFVEETTHTDAEFTIDPRLVKITTRTGIDIRRTLPHRRLRTIGAWCFVDHYGPTDQIEAMSVAAHPHAGLQTVSWLFQGQIEHRDSLGHIQEIEPGELNLMTSGRGIAHSELSINKDSSLHGVQLWIALPEGSRNIDPSFTHYDRLPVFTYEVLHIRLFVGKLLGHKSEAITYSELIGAEIDIDPESQCTLPTNSRYEYGILAVDGDTCVNGKTLEVGQLHYVAAGPDTIEFSSENGAKFVLLGGAPFDEKLVVWWNFIGRTHEEIAEMRNDWENHSERFADFEDRMGGRIPAPVLPNVRLTPRGNLDPRK